MEPVIHRGYEVAYLQTFGDLNFGILRKCAAAGRENQQSGDQNQHNKRWGIHFLLHVFLLIHSMV